MQIVVDKLLTSYARLGSGKTVLILHGWADSAAGWKDFAAKLATKYDVVTVDLPGFGGTQVPADTWGLTEYASFVAAFIAKLKLKPGAIIGHSNGGAIAIRGLASATLQAEKLVLLASAGIRNEQGGRKATLKAVAKTGKLLSVPLPASTKRKLRQKLYASAGSDLLVAEHLQETFKRVVGDDVRTEAAKITVPTLLVYGENDDATPVRFGELFHEAINGSTLEILPAAGHFLHLEQADKVAGLIQDFLR